MALYALDTDDIIYANDADPRKTYWCIDCFGPLKRRKGKWGLAHFYHLKAAPSCRLYSKALDHLVAQKELKESFPEGALQIEKPFLAIDRVADACWEKEKIIFEIQCSPISEKEVEFRMRDYKSLGYDVTWLLSDQTFNRRLCSPAEMYLRKRGAYYISIQNFHIYDQFEILVKQRRWKKSSPKSIHLKKPLKNRHPPFDVAVYPQQIVQLTTPRYFEGDRLSYALRYPHAMLYWRSLEIEFAKREKRPNRLLLWLRDSYLRWLDEMIKGR